MNAAVIPEAAESLLLHLLVADLRSARTIDGLRVVIHSGDGKIEENLEWLIERELVYIDGDAIELTFAGVETARRIQARRYSQESDQAMPTVDTHPLRTGTERLRHNFGVSHEGLRYLLAFAESQNALPIPVLDGDTLGRLPETDISLQNDDFISGEHCRFSLEINNDESALYVEDLGSRNGSYMNDTRLKKGQLVRLEHGDRLMLGSTVFIIVKIPY